MLGCSSLGEDICILSKEVLDADLIIHIGIGCGENHNLCNFTLISELAIELMLEDAKPLQLYLTANETKIIRFYVPEDPDVTHISIFSRAWNSFSKF